MPDGDRRLRRLRCEAFMKVMDLHSLVVAEAKIVSRNPENEVANSCCKFKQLKHFCKVLSRRICNGVDYHELH